MRSLSVRSIIETDRPTSHLAHGEISNGQYLREGSSDPLHVWFYGGVFGVGRSNGADSFLTKFNGYLGETMREE